MLDKYNAAPGEAIKDLSDSLEHVSALNLSEIVTYQDQACLVNLLITKNQNNQKDEYDLDFFKKKSPNTEELSLSGFKKQSRNGSSSTSSTEEFNIDMLRRKTTNDAAESLRDSLELPDAELDVLNSVKAKKEVRKYKIPRMNPLKEEFDLGSVKIGSKNKKKLKMIMDDNDDDLEEMEGMLTLVKTKNTPKKSAVCFFVILCKFQNSIFSDSNNRNTPTTVEDMPPAEHVPSFMQMFSPPSVRTTKREPSSWKTGS